MSGNAKKLFLFSCLLGVSGFVLNGFPLSVFGSVAFFFGGALYLLPALCGAPVYSGLAALLATSRVLWLAGHPYLLPISVLEALFIGGLVRRRWTPLLAGLIFWTLVGIPSATLIYVVYLKIPFPLDWEVVLKLPLNGWLNLLSAEILLAYGPLQRLGMLAQAGQPRKSLQSHLLHGFLVIAALPLLLLSIFSMKSSAENRQNEAAIRLSQAAQNISLNVDQL